MTETQLEFEEKFLSPYAMKSKDSKGREIEIHDDPLRTCFQRDRDRIIHSKAFRRLKHKTQVFLSPSNDHYRTRLTHTLEVTQIARTISRALRLNEDLTEAIGLGHDLGHTPFGHSGERVLNSLTGHFKHNEQSVRVVEILENDGQGLNLTYEVRDGILHHTSKGTPCTLEGKVVSYADRIAYINHDIDDAILAGVLKEEDLPDDCVEFLGKTKGDRINTMVLDVVRNSYDKDHVSMSKDGEYYMAKLREFMFEWVYRAQATEEMLVRADRLISMLFKYFISHPDEIEHPAIVTDIPTQVTDYIASMTDTYAINMGKKLFIPSVGGEN